MPCSICGTVIVRKNGEAICPKCKGFKIIDRSQAAKELQEYLSTQENRLIRSIREQADKRILLEEIAWYRERVVRDFFNHEKYPALNLHELLALNILIVKIIKEPDFRNNLALDYPKMVSEIVGKSNQLVQLINQFLLLKEELFEAVVIGGQKHLSR